MKSLHLLQARYWESSLSVESAKLIIQRKCFNMSHLLRSYLSYREKKYQKQAQILRSSIFGITLWERKVLNAKDRNEIFLHEARASGAYCKSFAVLAHCPIYWRRIYPHADDMWNTALNIGYTMIANILRKELEIHNLSLEIGLLIHFRQAKKLCCMIWKSFSVSH